MVYECVQPFPEGISQDYGKLPATDGLACCSPSSLDGRNRHRLVHIRQECWAHVFLESGNDGSGQGRWALSFLVDDSQDEPSCTVNEPGICGAFNSDFRFRIVNLLSVCELAALDFSL